MRGTMRRGLLKLWGNPTYTDMVLKGQGRGRTGRAQSEERTYLGSGAL